MSKIKERIEEIANDNDWKVSFENHGNETNIEFESFTTAGQDLIVNVWIIDLESLEDVRDAVYSYWEGFDECEETYKWLDSEGHGINGAPYHMGDILEDMVSAKQMIYHLSESFKLCVFMRKSIRAKVRVKIYTEFGKWCLTEIRGLREGTELEGVINPRNNAFDFKWNGEDAMLWVGHNAEVLTTHWEEASARAILRNRINDLLPRQCEMLSEPVEIMYQEEGAEEPYKVKITEVGRYGKRGSCRLVSEYDQLYSINEATPEECLKILHNLPIRH